MRKHLDQYICSIKRMSVFDNSSRLCIITEVVSIFVVLALSTGINQVHFQLATPSDATHMRMMQEAAEVDHIQDHGTRHANVPQCLEHDGSSRK